MVPSHSTGHSLQRSIQRYIIRGALTIDFEMLQVPIILETGNPGGGNIAIAGVVGNVISAMGVLFISLLSEYSGPTQGDARSLSREEEMGACFLGCGGSLG